MKALEQAAWRKRTNNAHLSPKILLLGITLACAFCRQRRAKSAEKNSQNKQRRAGLLRCGARHAP
jgi:hypothetical protein